MSLFLKAFWKLFLFLASVKVLWVSIKLLWWWWWMVMRKIIKLSWSYTNDDDDEAGILVSDTGNTGLMYCTPAGSASYLDLHISRIYIYIFFGGEGEKKHTSRTFRCASISSTYPGQSVRLSVSRDDIVAVMVADKEMDMVTDMALYKKKKGNNNWPTWSWTWSPTMKTKNMDNMVIDININMEI